MNVESLVGMAKGVDKRVSSGLESVKGSRKRKRQRQVKGVDRDTDAEVEQSSEAPLSVVSYEYPYETNSDDHCETKADAYELIADLLDIVARSLHKTRETLAIYDPYYCEGTMVQEMGTLGFKNVYNRKEDFYEVQREGRVPEYDVLITNPPYSENHIHKIVSFGINSRKPYFMLMPNYVYMKDYFLNACTAHSHSPFYVVPKKRLLYSTPKGRRQAKSAKFTSPFPSFWYCSLEGMPQTTDQIVSLVQRSQANKSSEKRVLCRRAFSLPVEVLTEADPRKKKERNALKRKKNKARKKQKI